MHQLAYWASNAVCNVSLAAQSLDDQVMLLCLCSFIRLIARKYGPMPEVTSSGPSLHSARHVMSKHMRVITDERPVKLHERHKQPSTVNWMRSQYWQSFSMWAIASVWKDHSKAFHNLEPELTIHSLGFFGAAEQLSEYTWDAAVLDHSEMYNTSPLSSLHIGHATQQHHM